MYIHAVYEQISREPDVLISLHVTEKGARKYAEYCRTHDFMHARGSYGFYVFKIQVKEDEDEE